MERGAGKQSLLQERALASSGELRGDSNIGQGQPQGADFVMTHDVQTPTSTTGGIGGSLLGRFGLLGLLAGGRKFMEAPTSLLIGDMRSDIQLTGAEGKASSTDFCIGGLKLPPGPAGAAGGFTTLPEGKLVTASLFENYNKIEVAIGDQPTLIKPTTTESAASAQGSTVAEAPQKQGQMLAPQIANVTSYVDATRDSAVVATMQCTDELVATGEMRNGFIRVDSANFSGWVQRSLVAPIPTAPMTAVAVVPLGPMTAGSNENLFGTLDGIERGNFQINVDTRVDIHGEGRFDRTGAFGLVRQVNFDENALMMQGHSAADNVTSIGLLDPSNGVVSGTGSYGASSVGALIRREHGGSFFGSDAARTIVRCSADRHPVNVSSSMRWTPWSNEERGLVRRCRCPRRRSCSRQASA